MASPEVGENLTKYELTIDVEKVPLVQKAKGRIEEMYNVMVEFDFIFKDKDGNDEQQWITIQGIGVGCKLAKEYIKSLCNPVESTVVKFPPELYPALSEQTVWARLEKDSHAVLVFNSDDEVSIMGADPLHVTLAMSSLEDMINTFLSSDISDFEPQGHLPSASKKASSLRLDQELRRQSSESGSIIIDEDLTSMRDEVKRAILGCVVEDPFTPWNRASEKADFIDVQNKKPVLVPPDAYELPAREDPLGSLSSGQRIPPSANAEIDLLLDEKLDLRDDVDHQANEINTKDDGLWAFAFDQGYSVSEIEEVFKQHGANLAPSQFHHALVKNRSSRPREKGNKGVLPSGSVLDSKGFPRKLPAPPEMGEKWQPDATTLATIQSQQNDAGKNRDDNLPSDYLAQLHIDFSEEEHCKTDELKKRNQERRKLLSAALDAEPEVHLNSKADAKKPSPPTTPQKKKGKQKKDTPKAKKTPPTNQAKKKVKATSQAKDNKKPIQGKGIENPYDLLTDDLEEKQEGQRQPAFVPPQVEFTQWGSLKDDSMSRKNNAEKEPDSMPWEVATRKGRTKKDQQAKIPGISYPKVTLHTKSTAASDSAVLQSYSPPKRASRWDQPPSAGQEANKVGIQKRPNNASPRSTSAQPRVSRWDQPPSQGQGSNKVDIQNRPNNASPRRTAAQTDGPKAPVAGYAVPTLGQKPLPQHITAVPGIVNDSQFGGSNWNAMPPQNHIAPYPAPNAAGKDKPKKLRWIVIDGSNVAMTHGNGVFSCKGIKICVDFFLERGHEEITVFVPQWRTRTANEGYPIRDQEILMELKDRGYLTLTPARKVQGKNIVCYDDRFIVKLAENTDGIIVSNDNYRDLWREKPEWREVIENRLLMYSFVGDFFMPPDDPLGQNGPTLDEYLSKPEKGRAKYFPPHRPAGNSYNGLQNAHNHNSAPNLAGGQYLGGFAQPPPMFAVPPPLMQQPPALWGQYQPQNMAWAAPQPPPNQRQKRTRNNSQNFAVNHGNSSQNSDGLHRSSSDVEITEWWKNTADPPNVAASGMTDNKRKGATKKKIGQQDSINRSNEQLRTDSQTQTLFSQLHGVFPESEEQINRILENHPSEASVDKLSAYLLEIL